VINSEKTGVISCPGAALKTGGPVYPCSGGLLQVRRPPVRGVEILHAGPVQHFSPALIEQGTAKGWLVVSGESLTITTAESVVRYRVVRRPGYYCCHCDRLLDDGSGATAHLAAAHAGVESPDPGNVAGYRRDNFYACRRED
jgi:hypothetical protein